MASHRSTFCLRTDSNETPGCVTRTFFIICDTRHLLIDLVSNMSNDSQYGNPAGSSAPVESDVRAVSGGVADTPIDSRMVTPVNSATSMTPVDSNTRMRNAVEFHKKTRACRWAAAMTDSPEWSLRAGE